MLRNIFILSVRNFLRNRINSFVIVISLVVGFSVANVLIGFIIYELNTDNYHDNRNRMSGNS
ncbi:MAG TPA: hypothetical protein VI583_07545 [Cyclobacteriaceae bacterium]|nr:hypothetical protein [Cyclobacteriaceae bacterium]